MKIILIESAACISGVFAVVIFNDHKIYGTVLLVIALVLADRTGFMKGIERK